MHVMLCKLIKDNLIKYICSNFFALTEHVRAKKMSIQEYHGIKRIFISHDWCKNIGKLKGRSEKWVDFERGWRQGVLPIQTFAIWL